MLFLEFVFFLGLGVLGWAVFVEPKLFQINRYPVKIRKSLPKPIRILHLSDIHFSSPQKSLARFFDRLAKEDVHLVFVTGDIIDCEAGIPFCVENLRKLRPRYGTFAVLGNHDYYDYRFEDVVIHNFPGQGFPKNSQNTALLERALKDMGVSVLKNETVAKEVEGGVLLIHGLDDPTTGRANVRKAMENFDPKFPNLLLTHTVDAMLDVGENEMDLCFSGHSHGGQIRLPFIGPIITHTMIGRPYASGIKPLKGTICSISRGVSASRHFFLRLLCPPEAIILTVVGADPCAGP